MRNLTIILLLITYNLFSQQEDERVIYRDTFESQSLNVIKDMDENDFEILNNDFDIDTLSFSDQIYIKYVQHKIETSNTKETKTPIKYKKATIYPVKPTGKLYKHKKRRKFLIIPRIRIKFTRKNKRYGCYY